MARRRTTFRSDQLVILTVFALAIGYAVIQWVWLKLHDYFPLILALVCTFIASLALYKLYASVVKKVREIAEFHAEAKYLAVHRTVTVFQSMDPIRFEQHVGKIFKHKGYQVQTTARSNDKGIDFILSKKGVLTAVQVKRYGDNVSSKEMREFLGSMRLLPHCNRGIFVTTSDFTREARIAGQAAGVELVDGQELEKLIEEVFPSEGYFGKQ